MFGCNAQHHIWQKANRAYQNKHIIPTFKNSDGGLIWTFFYSYRIRKPYRHQVNHEILCIAKYSGVKFEAIYPTAKAWPKLGHTTVR